MEGHCIFVFFMIFNSFVGITGLAVLAVGIYGIVKTKSAHATIISLTVVGGYITLILILGACSWKKRCCLITYFVLILLLIIVETTLAIVIYFVPDMIPETIDIKQKNYITACVIVFGVSAGISFLSFFFSAIYFCVMKKSPDGRLTTTVNNLNYAKLNAE